MTIDTGSRGLRFVADDSAVLLVDVRCGACAACRGGRDYWCLEARESGPVLAEIRGVDDGGLARRWTTALAALAAAELDASLPLLVLADAPTDLVTDLVAPWHAGAVVTASDARNAGMRERLAELSPTGRAPLVLTVTDVRAAVRAVERGGRVFAPDTPVRLPSVTELVQRDVTLVAARSMDRLVTGSSWGGLAERLGALLTALASAPTAAGAGR